MRHDMDVGEGDAKRRIVVLSRSGATPTVVWFGGFRSEMTGTKAGALDAWAAETGRAFLRFDYSGHGLSGGVFEDGTITRWLAEALAVVESHAGEHPVFVGSSMGGWVALLAARWLRERRHASAPSALVLIAPAPDFTERLMWAAFPENAREALLRDGVYLRPSDYDAEPYPITRALIEDGRNHLLLDQPFETGCPVRILQGMRDTDVPWEHANALMECLPGDDVQLTLVPDGDHRLSRPEDLERLKNALEDALRKPLEPDRQLRLTV